MTAAAMTRTPARITFKGETDFRTSWQQRAERLAFRMAHRLIANSEAVRARLISEGVSPKKIVRHYNGLDMRRVAVDENVNRNEISQELGLPARPGRRFVTVVANLRHAVKDIPMFLRAAARVRAAVPETSFVIAGEGELMPELRSFAAQLGLVDQVCFLGRCDRIGELLFISDVCALSSRAEGFSNSILEYMAAARPVVATDVGGAREAIVEAETGYIVPAGDDEQMAERIIGLLRDPQRAREMGQRGKQRVERDFSADLHLAKTLELYANLLGKAATGADDSSHVYRSIDSSASRPNPSTPSVI
jgi:glycosyltransferase involved in cell wall biosynthesis